MIRLFAFIILVVVALMQPMWVFVAGALVYGYFFSPYEALVLAILIDAYFGESARTFAHVYTLWALVVLCGIKVIQPRLQV